MSEGSGTFYAIGSRKSGILFVTTDPLRISIVSRDEIQRYADAHGKSFDAAFGEYAAAASRIIIQNDLADLPADVAEVPEAVGHQIAGGMTMSDADFCFISEIDLSGFSQRRNIYPPLAEAMASLTGSGDLRAAVERDAKG